MTAAFKQDTSTKPYFNPNSGLLGLQKRFFTFFHLYRAAGLLYV